MPTSKPRINLTLEPEQYELITELARLRGVPRTQIVKELFGAAEDVLKRVVILLQASERAAGSFLQEFEQGFREAESKLQPLVDQVFQIVGGVYDDLDKWEQ